MNIFEAYGYSPEEAVKLEAHIDETLCFIDPDKIGNEYKNAARAGDKKTAVAILAAYYRARDEYDIAEFSRGAYNKKIADNGVCCMMREVNIDHHFEDGRIGFLFNPTLEHPPVNHEWLWQLNRHSWWPQMARAYADTSDERYAAAFNKQLLDWVVQTDIPENWNGVGSAWRTIECGLRLMGSWQTAFNLFRKSESFTDEALVIMLGSMHRQAVHLAKNPTRSNWLLMETNGVYTFASLFGEFSDAGELRSLAYGRILRELTMQILPDGMQYELSPDYHSVSSTCAQGIYKTALATGKADEFPEEYRTYLYRMAMAALDLATPAFTQPRTNDCYTIPTKRLTSFIEKIFPDDPAIKFVNSERREGSAPEGVSASRFLPWAGFAAMRSDWSANAAYLCFDVGPLGMAHAHSDKLNINLYKGDEELIFDDGGGQYEQSRERFYGISAYDHNTVTVDGFCQSRQNTKKVDSPIDAGWITNDTFDYAYGNYDEEFGESKFPAVHRREVRFCKPDLYIVRDTLTSKDGEAHVYGLRFHMDTTTTEKLEGGAILAKYGRKYDLLVVPVKDAGEASGDFEAYSGATEPNILGWYIGRNDASNHPATTIIMESEPTLEHHFTTLLIPIAHGDALPAVVVSGGVITITIGGKTVTADLSRLDG